MRIAYIISAYKYPKQLIRLICRLNTDTTSFFVHIDNKTDDEIYLQVVSALRTFPNVHFLSRHRCHWGDFGHVRATIKGIAEIIRTKLSFDYVILLTGQDYPIKTNEEIKSFLKQSKGKSYLHNIPLPCKEWPGTAGRMESWHIHVLNTHITLPILQNDNSSLFSVTNSPLWLMLRGVLPKERKFPQGFKPYGGSSYWCLSKECVDYVYSFIMSNRSFVKFFKYVYVPDEHFFQTILLNSYFKDTIVNDNLRYIDWSGQKRNPAVLTREHFNLLAGSSKLFARKFDMTIDNNILDMIDHVILNKQNTIWI